MGCKEHFLVDLETAVEICRRSDDIPGALDLQWTVLNHLRTIRNGKSDTILKDGDTLDAEILKCLQRILELTTTSRSRIFQMFRLAIVMVDKGVDINLLNYLKHSLLYLAVDSGCSQDIVESLLQRGADVDRHIWTSEHDSLSHAARKGNFGLVETFVDYGTKVSGLANKNLSAYWRKLQRAIKEQWNDIPRNYSLLDTGMEERWFYAAMQAARAGSKTIVRLFLEYEIPVRFFDHIGQTLLSCAVKGTSGQMNNHDLVKFLLEKGANVNFQTKTGNNPLKSAVAYNNSVDVIDLLLLYGADVNITNDSGD